MLFVLCVVHGVTYCFILRIIIGTEATRNNPSIFQRMSMSIFRTPSVSDQHSNQAEDPENGLELNDFGDESDRRSSMMIETEHQGGHTKQSSERFDLGTWCNMCNFYVPFGNSNLERSSCIYLMSK